MPVTYKHNPNGTTIVGINCNANDAKFYSAVKNRNVWAKYSDEALGNMIKGLSKGMDGKGVGTWGGKGQDWSIAGFAEFNTKDPSAPWNVTLVGTVGIKYSKSAQYFCLTGTITGGAGFKFLGSVIRNPKTDTYSGYLDAGGYGSIELFGGIGAGTIAAVGVYGRGRLEAMVGLLPKSNFGFKSISVSGDAGLKAVAFGFDIVRWVVLETKNGPVVAYIADATQVGVNGRDSANRTVLVYSRYQVDGTWTTPQAIDISDSKYGSTPDYNPAIFAFPDSNDFYVTWLDARSQVSSGETFGEIAKKLDVRFARVDVNDEVITNTVFANGTYANGAPSLYMYKVDDKPIACVGWSTNETTGDEGQIIGTSGSHNVYMSQKSISELVTDRDSWTKTFRTTDSGAITSLEAGMVNGKPAVLWSVDKTYAQRCKKADGSWTTVEMDGLNSLNDSTVYKMTWDSSGTTFQPVVEKVADNATGVQPVVVNGTPTMAYSTWARADESGNFCSIYDAGDKSLLLDGTTVGPPTPITKIAGDIGSSANAGMVTCMRTTNAASVASMVKKGSTAKDWGAMVEATNAKGNITSYDVVYHDGAPMIVYTVASASVSGLNTQSDVALSTQADDSDETTSLEVASGTALRDADIDGVYYDEMEVDAGQVMPVTVDFTNDGVVPLDGVDVYTYNETLDDGPVLQVSTSDTVESGDQGTASFDLQLPDLSQFSEEMRYYVLVVPKGTTGVTTATMEEEGDDSLNFNLGDPHLALETEHHLVDGQESVVATVKNEGMVTSEPATLVFEHSESGIDLERIEVPALAENESFTYEYNAADGYFQNTGVENLTIMLEDPNDPDDIYSLYNTDSIYTWEIDDNETPAATKASSSAPKTGDDFALGIVLALLALAVLTAPIVALKVNETRER